MTILLAILARVWPYLLALAIACPHFAFADQRQRAMTQRRKVAARTKRAVLVDNGREPSVEQRCLAVDEFRAHTRERHRQAASAQQQHRPHHFHLNRIAHAGCV